MITAGKLDRTIILSRRTLSKDRIGATVETWSEYATTHAERVTNTTRDFLRAEGEGAEGIVVFRLRWRPDVSLEDRVAMDGRTFEIIEAVELGRRRGLELRCRERT
ncbi:phage head closure protein [Acuticoccus yangtzensis]|uniref:phage head closure protein n=1 Tax=Acuticoccus yangtzensis TaxID=1443441 RepID=UPI0009499DDD|nr:phage head closure protein [Acuticoccus yangtzensis]